MRKIVMTMFVLAVLVSCTETKNNAQSVETTQAESVDEIKKNQNAITAVIRNYESALSSGNVASILDTYHDNAMFLLFNHEPMQGKGALKEFYTGFFKNVSSKMEMEIKSIEISEDLAYVISVSNGKVEFLTNGAEFDGAGQELFVLKKSKSADWKIIAYHASSRIKNDL